MMGRTETTAYILKFSLPVIAGSVLQQLYNMMDAVIVGRFLGETSLAAVSVASPIMSLLIFFIYGIGIGMTVLFSQKYGAGDKKAYRDTANTALCGGSLFVLFLTVVFFIVSRPILLMANTPEEVLPQALAYLRIVVGGLIFTFLYDYFSAALLAVGDSRTSFYALALSSILNIFLDVLFIAVFHLGIAGAAAATVAAQCVSMLVCTWYVRKGYPILAFRLKELRMKKEELVELVRFSGASAIQQSILYCGRLLVQGAVNSLSIGVIAGYGAACRIESFVLAPLDGIASSTASFCAREAGQGHVSEIKNGFFSGIKISVVFSLIISAGIYIFSPRLVALFLKEISGDALGGGVIYLRYMAIFYGAVSLPSMLQALFRGIGRLRITVISTLLQIAVRVIMTSALIHKLGISAVCWGTLTGWFCMILYCGFHAARFFKSQEQGKRDF